MAADFARQRSAATVAAVVFLLLTGTSCERAADPPPQPLAASSPAFQFAQQIGWLHGACLAMTDPNVVAGTRAVLVLMDDPQKTQEVRIGKRTESPESCQPLMEGRKAINAKPGTFFYLLEGGTIDSTDMGFGIVAPPAKPVLANGAISIDLDQNGHSVVFSSCATSEGIKFTVWNDKAYQGTPRWSGYYYLDYDSKPNCPK
jgi:hypothetical protein